MAHITSLHKLGFHFFIVETKDAFQRNFILKIQYTFYDRDW